MTLRELLRRLTRGNFAIVSLSIGSMDYGNGWGLRSALLGIHMVVCLTPTHWLDIEVAAWPWNGRAVAWQFFPRGRR